MLEAGKKIARGLITTIHSTPLAPGSAPAPEKLPESWPPPPERIDVDLFVDKHADFDALMIRQAEELPQIAYGLLRRKTALGEPGAISAATKNWHEAVKAAADVRERFVALQEKTRALISLDDVADVVATELREVRKLLGKVGARAAPAANPADPDLAQRAIDAAVDVVLANFNTVIDRAHSELAVAHEQPDPAFAPAAAAVPA